MKKKLLALVLVVVLGITSVVGGTMAYLQDTDEAVNVMTLGNVYIEQIEQERDENGNLVDFSQNKPAYPAVGEIAWADTGVTVNGTEYKVFSDGLKNVVDKIVTVKNTGKTSAYVRTIIAIEAPDGDPNDLIHVNVNGDIENTPWKEVVIDGVDYVISTFTYPEALAAGEISAPSLMQVFLASKATNEDCAKFGNTWEILVVSQAIQSEGFADAETALNTGFGEISATNHPWIHGIVGEKWDGSADAEGLKENTDETAKTVTIYTPAQLAAFAEAVNGGETYKGYTVELATNIDLNNQPWTAIGDCETGKYFQGTFDGKGYTISNLYVDYSTDASEHATAGLFGWVDATGATVKNVNVDGATVKGSHWVGVIAGYWTGRIENCSVNNADVIAYNLNDNANGDKVGGIVGYLNEQSYINGNTLSNSTITGNRDVGGIAGAVAASTYEMKNNTVSDTTVSYVTDKDTYASAGEIVSGRTSYVPNETNKAINVSVIKTAEASAETDLMTVLKNAAEGKPLHVVLTGDVEYNTEATHGAKDITPASSVVIDGQGKYTLTATGDGVAPIGDNDAPITLKNLTVKDNSVSYAEDAWEFAYLEIGGAKLICENVSFTDPIMVESEEATFTNCSFIGYIDEANDNIKMNGVWMYSGDATFTGCTFTGTRGMKICDMYNGGEVGTVVIDNCTFNGLTQKPGVAIDDEDTQDMVITIKNSTFINCQPGDQGLYIYETDNTVPTVANNSVVSNVDTAEELNAAINAGVSVINLADGEYRLASSNTTASIKIAGSKNAVVDVTWGAYLKSATLTFEGVTIKGSTGYVTTDGTNKGSDYAALYSKDVTYNNCTFDGPFRIGRDGASYNTCTFNNLGNDYVWTYGNDATFKGCTFNTDGKALLIYSDGGSEVSKVVVENCTFNSTAGAKAGAIANQNCAAIEIQNYGNGVNLTTSGNIIDSDFSGEWRIKAYHSGKPDVIVNGTEYTSIAIDGKTMTIDTDKNVTVNG